MSSPSPFASVPNNGLIFSGGIPKSMTLDEGERKKLIESFESNTYVYDGNNYNITWNLKSATKEQFIKALKENQVLKIGSMKGCLGGFSFKMSSRQSQTNSVNGKVVSSTSSNSTTEKNEPGKSFHTLLFSLPSNIFEQIELEIGSLVTPVQTNAISNDGKENEQLNSSSSSSNGISRS